MNLKNKNSFFTLCLTALVLTAAISAAPAHAKKKSAKPADRAIMHNNAGVTALYQGDTDRALFEFKTATELSPNYVEGWNNLGLAYKFKGQLEQSIVALKRAISLDSRYASPYNHLGSVYFNLGRYSDAIAEFKKAIKYNKQFSDAYYNMGLTQVAMAHRANNNRETLNAAAATLVKATTLNAEHPHAHNELAKLYQELGQYEQAIIRYKLALEINPNLTDSWLNLSTLYNQTGETLKAQQALEQAMRGDADSPYLHMNLGISYLNEKSYILALKEFDQVIRKMPTNEIAYFNVGFAHFQMGIEAKNKGLTTQAHSEFNEAIKAYASAFKLKPTFADAAYNAAFAYQTLNDIPNAITWYQKSLGVDPNYARALYSLGEVYQAQGDAKNASAQFCKLLTLKSLDIPVDLNRLKQQVTQMGGCK